MIKHKQSGFTLIELLVVIAVIGILAAVIVASLNTARAKGRDARRIRDIQEIHNAIELYISDYGIPPDLNVGSCAGPEGECFATDISNGWPRLNDQLVPYIASLPVDPCGFRCDGLQEDINNGFFSYYYSKRGLTYQILAQNLETKSQEYGFTFTSY